MLLLIFYKYQIDIVLSKDSVQGLLKRNLLLLFFFWSILSKDSVQGLLKQNNLMAFSWENLNLSKDSVQGLLKQKFPKYHLD